MSASRQACRRLGSPSLPAQACPAVPARPKKVRHCLSTACACVSDMTALAYRGQPAEIRLFRPSSPFLQLCITIVSRGLCTLLPLVYCFSGTLRL